MVFKKIRLRNFRNFSDTEVSFSDRLNFFVGNNGQGKTNILEALHLFTYGDSFRYSDNSTLIKKDAKESFLVTDIEKQNLNFQLRLVLQKSKKNFFKNDKKVSALDLRKNFHSVVFSPESLSFIKEASDIRRNLIDDLLITVAAKNSDLLADYKKALKTRNKILKDHLEGVQSRDVTLHLLQSLNPSFLRLAADLTWARIQALNAIQNEFTNAMRYISRDRNVEISVEYVISGENLVHSSLEKVVDSLQKRIDQLLDAELASGVSLVGPHKHQIIFLYNQNDSRFFCSQGQQRAIILSFKIAQIVYHRKVHDEYPVLLLDDVLSELDSVKKDALISFLHEIKTQTFITTTDLHLPEVFHLDQTAVVRIENGEILKV